MPCQAPHSPDDKPPKVAFMGSELPGAAALGGMKRLAEGGCFEGMWWGGGQIFTSYAI